MSIWLVLFLMISGCGMDASLTELASSTTTSLDSSTIDSAPPPMEPPSCEVAADCEQGCPPDASGCTCFEQRCIPTCQEAMDCPLLPDGTEAVCMDQLCLPAEN